MLMVLSCDLRRNVHFMCHVPRFIRFQAVRIDNTRRFDFEFDRTVKGEIKVKAILVVGHCADGRNDQLSIPRYVDSHVSEVGVLVQDTSVFLAGSVSDRSTRILANLLDTNSRFNSLNTTRARGKVCVEVGDAAQTITA